MKRNLFIFAMCLLAMLAFGGAALVSAKGAEKSVAPVASTSRINAAVSTSADNSVEVCVMNYSDVPQGSTFYDYVFCLYCRGIISGYPDNTFRPNANVTRGQLAKFVAQSIPLNSNPGLQLFQDVPPGTTFYTDINNLTQVGYINGYDCGGPGEPCGTYSKYFRPNSPASRGQIAKIVTQAVGWYDAPGNQMYYDVTPGSTFYDVIQRLSIHNAATGYPCGGAGEPCHAGNLPYFRPNANVTRGQLSKIDVIAFFPECLLLKK